MRTKNASLYSENTSRIYALKCVILLSAVLVSGCASTYPCGEPGAGKCSSVSTNHERSYGEYTNSEDLAAGSSQSGSAAKTTPIKLFNFKAHPQIPANGSPLVSQPTMMRVWLTPYTDSDNVYHDQSYEYMITNQGQWVYGNNGLKVNNNVKNISLVQGVANKAGTSTNNDVVFNPTATSSANPTTFLNDYPALNALKNQSVNVPISTTTNVLTGKVN